MMPPSSPADRLRPWRCSATLLLGATAGLLLVACTRTHVVAGRLENPKQSTAPGVRYHLGRDMLVLTVTITEITTPALTENPDQPLSFSNEQTQVEGAIAVETIADRSSTYLLSMSPGGTADSTIGFKASASGLPTSINAESKDRSGEILGDVMEFAARIAGTFVRGAGFIAMAPPSFKPDERALVARPAASALAALRRAEVLVSQAEAEQRHAARELERLRGESPPDRGAIQRQREALEEATKQLAIQEAARLQALDRLSKAVDAARLAGVLSPIKRTATARYVVPMEELLQAHSPAADRIWQETGIVVAAELVPDSDVAASARTPPVPFSGSWASAQCRWPPALIHYRPTLPIRITVRTPDPKDGAGGGPLVAERIFNVLLPSTEPLAIQFEAVAFSTQGITVGFDDAGRLIEVKRSGTSPVAGATSGLAGGAKEAQEAYTSALDVRRKLIEQQRDLLKVQVEMEELKRQLAELEGQ